MRGIAILFVLLFHAFFPLPALSGPGYLLKKLTAPLWLGIDIFFVLSGFLITGILLDTRDAHHRYRSFYVHRILRIFPLYFALLAAVFFVGPALGLLPPTSAAEQWPYWTYLHNWTASQGHQVFRLTHLWTLSVEEQFYLAWPLLIFALPPRRVPVLCLALIASAILFRAGMWFWGFSSRDAYFLTPARLDDLSLGALAAWLFRDSRWKAHAVRFGKPAAALSLAGFALAIVVGRGFEVNKWPALLWGTTCVSVLAAILILASSETPRTGDGWRALVGSGALRWLGIYSYGIYILHQPIFNAVADRVRSANLLTYLGAMTLAALVSAGCAWLSYHVFEQRFLRLKRRFPAA